MNTEPKPRMVILSYEQAAQLLERKDDVGVPHVYLDSKCRYAVKADEWRAFQAISGGQQI
jgi:hypothetical protein